MANRSLMSLVRDIFTFPNYGRGVRHVWSRNYLLFQQTIFTSTFWIFIEPIIYLVAIGYGIGSLVESVDGRSYIFFFAPAIMSMSGMVVAFYEATYGAYERLYKKNNFKIFFMSPISSEEIILGEIIWSATKGMLASMAVCLACLLLGIMGWETLLPTILIIILNCWLFASLGMLLTSFAKSTSIFVYIQTGLILPMYLLSGTFYPTANLPEFLQKIVLIFPLTHATFAIRQIFSGEIHSSIFLSISVLFFTGYLASNWAVVRLSKKLVK